MRCLIWRGLIPQVRMEKETFLIQQFKWPQLDAKSNQMTYSLILPNFQFEASNEFTRLSRLSEEPVGREGDALLCHPNKKCSIIL